MEKLILSGFSDEIAESFDAQLDAVAEFGLSHIEPVSYTHLTLPTKA